MLGNIWVWNDCRYDTVLFTFMVCYLIQLITFT